jgi:hypothetical protein
MQVALGSRTRASTGIVFSRRVTPLLTALVALVASAVLASTAGAADSVFWGNNSLSTIARTNLDGTGSGSGLSTSGATIGNPTGVAIDPAANKIYWVSAGANKISEANLDGTGEGHDLSTSGASIGAPDFPALLKVPAGMGAPAISGGSSLDSTLSCSKGSWAADLLGSFVYRAPRSFSYSWSDSGTTISGATQSSITADSPGSYRCQVTADNAAGSASQTSPAHTIEASATHALAESECVVPKLRGKKLKRVKKALRNADCSLGKVRPRGKKSGRVKKQHPNAGKVVPAGTKVNVKLG